MPLTSTIGRRPRTRVDLLGRDVAHRRQDVGLAGGRALERVFAPHRRAPPPPARGSAPPAPSRPTRRDRAERAPEHRRVRREHRRHRRQPRLHVQQRRARHPLVDVQHALRAMRPHELVPPPLDHDACGVPEQQRFDVVPRPEERVDAVLVPQPPEDVVLRAVEPGRVHEDRPRPPRHPPPADAHRHPERSTRLREAAEPRVLVEEGLAPRVAEAPRAHAHVAVAEALHHRPRLRREHRVDAADLVGDLPRHLEHGQRGRGRWGWRGSQVPGPWARRDDAEGRGGYPPRGTRRRERFDVAAAPAGAWARRGAGGGTTAADVGPATGERARGSGARAGAGGGRGAATRAACRRPRRPSAAAPARCSRSSRTFMNAMNASCGVEYGLKCLCTSPSDVNHFVNM